MIAVVLLGLGIVDMEAIECHVYFYPLSSLRGLASRAVVTSCIFVPGVTLSI
jgi:hypothetical protein